MPHPNHVSGSKPCLCRDCPHKPKSDDKLLYGSRIDRLYYDKYLPLRERKLLEKLVRTRAVYDDIRTRILSSSSEDDDNRLTDRESKAINEFVGRVDRGELPSFNSSVSLHSACCSCCRCQAKYVQPKVHMHVPSADAVNDYISKQNMKKNNKKRKFKSDPCLCALKLSLRKNRRKYEKKHLEPIMRGESLRKVERQKNDHGKYVKNRICKCTNKLRHAKKFKKRISSSISVRSHKFKRRRIPKYNTQEFNNKKDSLEIYKERMKKKWTCEPDFCDPDDCVPEDCYEEILKNELPDPDRSRVVTFRDEYSQTMIENGQNKNIVTDRDKNKHIEQKTEDFRKEKNQTIQRKVNIKKTGATKTKKEKNKISMIFCECKLLLKSASSNTEISMANASSTKLMSSQMVSTVSLIKTKQHKKRLPFPRKCVPYMCDPGDCNPSVCAEILLKNAQATHKFEPCFCTLGIKKHKKERKNKETKIFPKTSPSETQTEIDKNETIILKDKKGQMKRQNTSKKFKKVKVTCECTVSKSSMTDVTLLRKTSNAGKNLSMNASSNTAINMVKQPFPRACEPFMCKPGLCEPKKCAKLLSKMSEGAHQIERCFCTLDLKKHKHKKSKKIKTMNLKHKKAKQKTSQVECDCLETIKNETLKLTSSSKSQTEKEESELIVLHEKKLQNEKPVPPKLSSSGGQTEEKNIETTIRKRKKLQNKKPVTLKLTTSESQTEKEIIETTVLKEKKTQKKKPKSRKPRVNISCECLRSTYSSTQAGKYTRSSTNTAMAKSESTMLIDKRKDIQSLPFPRECDPYMCEPGECNPQICADILLKRSQNINKLNRCFCTLNLKKHRRFMRKRKSSSKIIRSPPKIISAASETVIEEIQTVVVKEKKNQKKEPVPKVLIKMTSSGSESKIDEITTIIVKEKKVQKKEPKKVKVSCGCSKSSYSMTTLGKNKTSATNTAVTKSQSTMSTDKQPPFPFPRECDPYMCKPGECDPQKCAEILLRRSKKINQSDRCFCTFNLKKHRTHKIRKQKSSAVTCECFKSPIIEDNTVPKVSYSESQTNIDKLNAIVVKEKKMQRKESIAKVKISPELRFSESQTRKEEIETTLVKEKKMQKNQSKSKELKVSCECLKSIASMTELRKNKASSTDIVVTKTESTVMPVDRTGVKSLPFPKECDPYMCIPGECDPQKCSEMLLNRSENTNMLNRCFCTLNLKKRPKPKNLKQKSSAVDCECSKPIIKIKTPPKISYSESQTNIDTHDVIIVKEKKIQKKEPITKVTVSPDLKPSESQTEREEMVATVVKEQKTQKEESKSKVFCECSKSIASMTELRKNKASSTEIAVSKTESTVMQVNRKGVKSLPFPRECDPHMCVPGECDPQKCAEILLKRSKENHQSQRCFCTLELKKRGKKQKYIKTQPKISTLKRQTDMEMVETKAAKEKKVQKKEPITKVKIVRELRHSESQTGRENIEATVVKEKKTQKKESKSKVLRVSCECSKSIASMTYMRKDKASSTDIAVTKTESTVMQGNRKGVKTLPFPRECDPYMCVPGECDPQKCADILLNRSENTNMLNRCFCTLNLKKRQRPKKLKQKLSAVACECSKPIIKIKTPPKISHSESQTNIDKHDAIIVKEKKIQMNEPITKVSVSPNLRPSESQTEREKIVATVVKEQKTQKKESKSKVFCECSKSIASMTELRKNKASSTEIAVSKTESTVMQVNRKGVKFLPFPRECDPYMCVPGECDPQKCAEILLKRSKEKHQSQRCFCTLELKKSGKKQKYITIQPKTSSLRSRTDLEMVEANFVKEENIQKKELINKVKIAQKLRHSESQTGRENIEATVVKEKKTQKKESKSKVLRVSCECSKSIASMTDMRKDKASSTDIAVTKTESTVMQENRKGVKSLPFPRECDPYMCVPGECDPQKCADILLNRSDNTNMLNRCFCTLNLKKRQKPKKLKQKSSAVACECSKPIIKIKTPPKISHSESQTNVDKHDAIIVKEKKIQNKEPITKVTVSPDLKPSESQTEREEMVATVVKEQKTQKKESKSKMFCECSKSIASMTDMRKNKASSTEIVVTKTESTVMPVNRKGVKSLPFPRECDPYMCVPGECDPQKCADILLNRSEKKYLSERCFCTLDLKRRGKNQKYINTQLKTSSLESQTDIQMTETKVVKEKKVQKKDFPPKDLVVACECTKDASSNTELPKHITSYTNAITTKTKSTKPKEIKEVATSLPFPRECDPFMCVPGECDPKKCAAILKRNSRRANQSDRCFCTLDLEKKIILKSTKVNCDCTKLLSSEETQVIKSSESQTKTEVIKAKVVKEKYIQKKDKGSKSSSSMTDQGKTQSSSTNVSSKQNKHTTLPDKQIGKKPFPRECDPYMCVPGECDPKECAQILLRNSGTSLERCFCTLQIKGNTKQKHMVTKEKKVQMKEPRVQKVLCECDLHIKTSAVAATQPARVKSATKDTSPRAKKFKAVQKELERCFCTLKFQPAGYKERRQRKLSENQMQDPKFNTSFSQSNGGDVRLLPYECEPLFCIPGECDPMVCEERIRARTSKYIYSTTGTDAPKKVKIISASETKPPKGVQTRKLKSKKPLSKVKKEKEPYPPKSRSSANAPGRQVVRISSSFTFDIEFFKEKNYPDTNKHMDSPVYRSDNNDAINESKLGVNREHNLKYRNKETGKTKKYKHRKEGNPKSRIKCFCSQIFKKSKRRQITQTKIESQVLLPYACEPGYCVPGDCNPEQCQERIRKRNLLERCFCTLALQKNQTATKKTG